MVILQDLERRWLSCKILQEEWLSSKILKFASSFRSSSAIIGCFRRNIFHIAQTITQIEWNEFSEIIWNKIYTGYLQFITALGIIFAPVDNEWLSCKILQDSGKILQDDTLSCKIFSQNLARSCKITLRLARILQDNHSTCKYANKWNMIEQVQNETRTLLPINFLFHCDT